MATPGTPINIINGGAAYATTSDIVGTFRTLLTHISELFTPDNARSLAYINGLPDNSPHKPLDVLMELEKRGVFSHENVDPLISLLTGLHRVDIINTCGVREYKEMAEQSKLTRGDSFGSFGKRPIMNDFTPSSWHQSLEKVNSAAEFESEHQPLHQHCIDEASATETMAGMDHTSSTPDNYLNHQRPPLATSNSLHSLPGSEELPPVKETTLPSLPSQNLKILTEEAKADLITKLANDPEGMSLMRALVASTTSEATDSNVNSTHSKLQSLHLGDVPLINNNGIKHQAKATPTLQCEATPTSHSTTPTVTSALNYENGDVLSPPVEFKSIDTSLTYGRQTSSTSTQTDNEVIGSIASSEGTGCTSGYNSIQAVSLTQEIQCGTNGSVLVQEGTVPPSAAAVPCHDGDTIGLDPGGASEAVNGRPPRSSRFVPEFDSNVEAINKCLWKEKRLHLCDCICKHSSKTISKDMKISCSQQGDAKKCRKLGKACDVKLTFRLCPYGVGSDEGRFMSMKVCVHVDRKCPQLKGMATLHLKITTRLPSTEFVSVRTATNQLEDFVINNFIPHEVVINQSSKCIEFAIETYLNFDLQHISVYMSADEEKELIASLAVLDDPGSESNDQFEHIGQ